MGGKKTKININICEKLCQEWRTFKSKKKIKEKTRVRKRRNKPENWVAKKDDICFKTSSKIGRIRSDQQANSGHVLRRKSGGLTLDIFLYKKLLHNRQPAVAPPTPP